MTSRRVLITGAGGFIGANLARRLLRDGHNVHLLVRRDHDLWRIGPIRAAVQMHVADLRDAETLDRVVRRIRPDWIFHLAAHGAYAHQTDFQHMVQTNLIGTMNLVQSSLRVGVETFVHTGSSSEYGFKDHAMSETELPEPNSDYAVTKAATTLFCRSIAQRLNLRLFILRLFSVYGPYEEPMRLVPSLLLYGVGGKLPPLASAASAHDFVYVDDVCEVYCLAAMQADQEPGAVYNVGTGIQLSLREVVEVARRVLGIAAEPRWNSMKSRPWDASVWVADTRKVRRVLGWQSRCGFEEGFRQTWRWLQGHSELLRRYQAGLAGMRRGEPLETTVPCAG